MIARTLAPRLASRGLVALVLAAMIALALAVPAAGTHPGSNGPIAHARAGASGADDVWLVNPDGSGVTNLTNSPATDFLPAISPDGQRVAFTSDRDGNNEIYVIGIDGSALARLTNDPGDDSDPAWSPDSTQLVFSSDRVGGTQDLFVMNADGSGQTNVTNTPMTGEIEPDWSPDGTRLAFILSTPGGSGLQVMPTAGGAPSTLFSGGSFSSFPSWSPDGTRIAFHTDQPGNSEVFAINADGTAPVNLTNHPAFDGDPSWSPDGTRIVFFSDRVVSGDPDLFTMATDGSGVTPVIGAAVPEVSPSWGPVALDPVTRLFGPERIATAVAISGDYVMSGAAGAAVLARSDLFPDALAGAPLAFARGGPLLLTPTASLHATTAAELQRVLPPGATVYLLGSTAALSAQVEADVQALGYATTRLGGANRFATAVAIANELGAPTPLYVADGGTFQAAEISGVAAAVNGGAVLLTSGTTMAPETSAYIATRGGVARFAVGPQAIGADPGATPVGGGDAYEVSRNLATTAFGPNPPAVALASGTVFADGLTGGPHIAQFAAPLLLTDPAALPASVRAYLLNHAPPIGHLYVYGGTAAISDPVVADAQRAISGL